MEMFPKSKADLLKMIEVGAQESLTLEFKNSKALEKTDKKKQEISKDISAFANSQGGVIIYGIQEEGHSAASLDLGNDPQTITKEWIEQVINSTIHKRIEGIVIHQISLKSAKGNVIYAVRVPSSSHAPHQASDKRFYKRYNFQNIPMEEYEIEDMRNRGQFPDLRVGIQTSTDLLNFSNNTAEYSEAFRLIISVSNDSDTPANYAVIELYIDERIQVMPNHNYQFSENSPVLVDEDVMFCYTLSRNWHVNESMPIWRGQPFAAGDISIKLPNITNGESYLLGYRVTAPGMNTKTSYKILNQGPSSISLTDFIDNPIELADKLGL